MREFFLTRFTATHSAILGALFALCVLFPAPQGALACECLPMDEKTGPAAVEGADVIAYGEISSIVPEAKYLPPHIRGYATAEHVPLSLISVNITRIYKGLYEYETLALYVDTESSCRYRIEPQDKFFVFARNYEDKGLIQTNICGLPPHVYWPEAIEDEELGLVRDGDEMDGYMDEDGDYSGDSYEDEE